MENEEEDAGLSLAERKEKLVHELQTIDDPETDGPLAHLLHWMRTAEIMETMENPPSPIPEHLITSNMSNRFLPKYSKLQVCYYRLLDAPINHFLLLSPRQESYNIQFTSTPLSPRKKILFNPQFASVLSMKAGVMRCNAYLRKQRANPETQPKNSSCDSSCLQTSKHKDALVKTVEEIPTDKSSSRTSTAESQFSVDRQSYEGMELIRSNPSSVPGRSHQFGEKEEKQPAEFGPKNLPNDSQSSDEDINAYKGMEFIRTYNPLYVPGSSLQSVDKEIKQPAETTPKKSLKYNPSSPVSIPVRQMTMTDFVQHFHPIYEPIPESLPVKAFHGSSKDESSYQVQHDTKAKVSSHTQIDSPVKLYFERSPKNDCQNVPRDKNQQTGLFTSKTALAVADELVDGHSKAHIESLASALQITFGDDHQRMLELTALLIPQKPPLWLIFSSKLIFMFSKPIVRRQIEAIQAAAILAREMVDIHNKNLQFTQLGDQNERNALTRAIGLARMFLMKSRYNDYLEARSGKRRKTECRPYPDLRLKNLCIRLCPGEVVTITKSNKMELSKNIMHNHMFPAPIECSSINVPSGYNPGRSNWLPKWAFSSISHPDTSDVSESPAKK